ncbi:MAG: hypothetical protein JWL68_327, partial [Actinomycetia bacterium]|nr:hypothetical protein [Actinomycetes bacterium]
MAQQRRGLGKGLGALIPTGPVAPAGGAVPGGRTVGAGEITVPGGPPSPVEQPATVGGAYF